MTAVIQLPSFLGNVDVDGLYQQQGTAYPPPTINTHTPGTIWGTTSLTYDIPANSTELGYLQTYASDPIGQVASSDHVALFAKALGMWAEFSGLTFTQVTESASVHGDLSLRDWTGIHSATTYDPIDGGSGIATALSGNVYWGTSADENVSSPKPGSYEYETIVHEIGHAIGFKHSFAGAPWDYSVSSGNDFTGMTVMSYNDHSGEPNDFIYAAANNEPETPMGLDIEATQWAYGANYGATAHNTDTVYSWNSTTGEESINGVGQGASMSGKIYMADWDGGGYDTYDFSNYTTNEGIDLRPGAWSTFSTAQLADLSAVTGGGATGAYATYEAPGTVMALGNLFNAYQDPNNPTETASLIEAAIGGSGNDTFHMNDVGDTITGGTGNDSIYGGAGVDTAIFAGNRSTYSENYGTSGWDYQTAGADGNDWVQNNVEWLKYADGKFSYAKVATGTINTDAIVANVSATHNTLVALSSVLSLDGEYMTSPYATFQLWNGDGINGKMVKIVGPTTTVFSDDVAQTISASDLTSIYVDVGSSSSVTDFVRAAYDGVTWGSWGTFTVTGTADTAPTVTAASSIPTSPSGAHFALSSLFTASDPNGSTDADGSAAIKAYQVWFGTGGTTNGSLFDKGTDGITRNVAVNLTVDQFNNTEWSGSSAGGDSLWVRASDGVSWSSWALFNAPALTSVSPNAHAPVVTTGNFTIGPPAGSLVDNIGSRWVSGTTDADSDTITKWQVWDDQTTSGPRLTFDGAAIAGGQAVEFSSAQMSGLTIAGGASGATDSVWARAWDGTQWGSWKNDIVTQAADSAPTVSASGASLNFAVGSTRNVSTLFSSADSDGSIAGYNLWDDSDASNSAYFTVAGIAEGANRSVYVTASQMGTSGVVDLIGASAAGITGNLYVQAIDNSGEKSSWLTMATNSH